MVRAAARFCGECGAALRAAATVRFGRRQVTALFCDIVDSTRLSERIDAEDLRDVLSAYQQSCAGIIERALGQVAQLFGDGLLAVFGVPLAREDDARRAVNAALDICRHMPALSRDVERRHGMAVAVRIGIHTGLVVIDEAGAGPASAQNGLVGNALHIGARLQALAPRDGVVISGDTYRLIQGHFVVETLGPRTLRGQSRPMQVYRVIEPSAVRSGFEARLARGLTPMVDRTAEMASLEEEWAAASADVARFVLLTGGPGIGKSRLLYEFQRRREQEDCLRIVCHCGAQYQGTAFHPIATELAHIFSIAPGNDREARVSKIAAGLNRVGIAAPEAARNLDLVFADRAEDAAPAGNAEGRQAHASAHAAAATRKQVIQSLTDYVTAAARIPLLLVFEDLHWADPSLLEFLSHLAQTLTAVPVLVLCSVRQGTFLELTPQRTIALDRLPPRDCTALIELIAGSGEVPHPIIKELVQRSDGVPLFVEELTKSVIDRLEPDGQVGSDASGSLSIVPASLQDAIMARLDRLGTAKEVAQAGALIGRSFHVELLSGIWNGARDGLQDEIDRLLDAEILFEQRQDARSERDTLEFKHELVRGVAAGSILRENRRGIHARIAAALARDFAEDCALHPELLAQHYAEAGDAGRALPLWEQAGMQAVRGSANREAVTHFTRALSLVGEVADPAARQRKELDLRVQLASSLMAAKGYGAPELDHTIERAMALSREIGDSARIFPLMYGRWSYDHVTGNIRRSRDFALQYLPLAERSDEIEPRIIAHRLAGTSLLVTGRLREAEAHLTHAIGLFDDEQHTGLAYVYGTDVKVMCQCSLAITCWALGHTREADAAIAAAWQRSAALGHAHTMAYCHANRLSLLALSGRMKGYADILASQEVLVRQHQLPLWSSTVPSFAGLLQLRQGDAAAAEVLFRQAIAAMQAAHLVYWQPMAWMWLGEVLGALGRFGDAEHAFVHCHALIEQSGECWAEAELFRLWAWMRRRAGAPGVGELLARAVAVARQQGAVAWERRALADQVARERATEKPR